MEEETVEGQSVSIPQEVAQGQASHDPFNEEEIVATESSGFDATLYEGQKAKIASMELSVVPDYYPKGVYDATSTADKTIVTVKTAPLKQATRNPDTGEVTELEEEVEFAQDDGTPAKKLQVTQRFNLSTKIVDGKKKIEISKHVKAKFWKFLNKMGATGDTMAEIRQKLIGKIVLITTSPSEKPGEEDKRYLGIVIE